MSAATKADYAYLQLRRAIVVGQVTADAALDEVTLGKEFDLGRTPIREALKRLAQDQFIVWPARRSPYVRDLSFHELQRLYESRMLMEKPAAGLAATRASQAQLEEIQRLGDELRVAAESGDVYESIEADHALHIAITRGADNRFLTEAVDRLNCGSLRLWYVAHKQLGLERVPEQHQEIIDALSRRDAEAAEDAAKRHIQVSLGRQLKLNFGGVDPTIDVSDLAG